MARKRKKPFAMSRRVRAGLFAAFALSILILTWLDQSGSTRLSARSPEGDYAKYHARKFVATNIVDGDTIDIGIPDGANEYTRIRLLGIDTPETKSPKYGQMYFGPEASQCTRGLVAGKSVTVFLDRDNRTRGKYGRLLAYVQLPDGMFLNEVLLSEGCAYADLRFRHSFYNKYQQLEALARKQKKGLWEKVAHEQLPQWLQDRKPNLSVRTK